MGPNQSVPIKDLSRAIAYTLLAYGIFKVLFQLFALAQVLPSLRSNKSVIILPLWDPAVRSGIIWGTAIACTGPTIGIFVSLMLLRRPRRVVGLAGVVASALFIEPVWHCFEILALSSSNIGEMFAIVASRFAIPIGGAAGWLALRACVARSKRGAELGPSCAGCGFSLQGAEWPRCPECGKTAIP